MPTPVWSQQERRRRHERLKVEAEGVADARMWPSWHRGRRLREVAEKAPEEAAEKKYDEQDSKDSCATCAVYRRPMRVMTNRREEDLFRCGIEGREILESLEALPCIADDPYPIPTP